MSANFEGKALECETLDETRRYPSATIYDEWGLPGLDRPPIPRWSHSIDILKEKREETYEREHPRPGPMRCRWLRETRQVRLLSSMRRGVCDAKGLCGRGKRLGQGIVVDVRSRVLTEIMDERRRTKLGRIRPILGPQDRSSAASENLWPSFRRLSVPFHRASAGQGRHRAHRGRERGPACESHLGCSLQARSL